MKKTNFIIATIMALALSFTSCSDDSSDGGSFVSFSGENYSGKWKGGFTDQYVIDVGEALPEPFASYHSSWTSGIGLREKNVNGIDSFPPNASRDYFYVAFNGNTIDNYNGGDSKGRILIRYANVNGGLAFKLTITTLDINKYNTDVIGGEFTGKDFAGKDIKGSFLFTNLGNNKWRWDTIPWDL